MKRLRLLSCAVLMVTAIVSRQAALRADGTTCGQNEAYGHYGDAWYGISWDAAYQCSQDPESICAAACAYCGMNSGTYSFCWLGGGPVPEYYGCADNNWITADFSCSCDT